MVEPLEETRSELTFATEPLLSTLSQSIPSASRSPLVDLDEVEVCSNNNQHRHLTYLPADPERHFTALQRPRFLAHVGAAHSLKHYS
jgi:hypothetical protein